MKLIMKRAKEGRLEATDASQAPIIWEGLMGVEGSRPGDLHAPPLKHQRVRVNNSRSRKGGSSSHPSIS